MELAQSLLRRAEFGAYTRRGLLQILANTSTEAESHWPALIDLGQATLADIDDETEAWSLVAGGRVCRYGDARRGQAH